MQKFIPRVMALLAMAASILVASFFVTCAAPQDAGEDAGVEVESRVYAEAAEEWDMEAAVERAREEERQITTALRGEEVVEQDPEEFQRVAAEAEKRRVIRRNRERSLRRWAWEAPHETRAVLWNIPQTEDAVATASALLRICISEADGSENDCIGIWQVLTSIRSRACNRDRIRLITECDDDGETMLSVMRRAQRYATGAVPPRSRRARWVSELELTCVQPESYPGSAEQWAHQYRRSCARTSDLVQRLLSGRHVEPVIKGVRPITWGGRCEESRGACDDPLACQRGLIRIRGIDTLNAFWRRPRTPDEVEPVCQQLLSS